jgi:DNA-binding MarR family transcriptional regulator
MPNNPADMLTEVMLLVFKLNGQLAKSGDQKVADLGLTSARWQTLGAIALSPKPKTAPQLARKLSVSRQGAQKQLNLLARDGLIEQKSNPRNLRSPFYQLTESGAKTYAQTGEIQADWARQLTAARRAVSPESNSRTFKKASQCGTSDSMAAPM